MAVDEVNCVEKARRPSGGILCGLTLCMDGWVEKFPDEISVGPFRRAEFVRNELRRGVEHVRGIRIPKGKDAKSGESEAS